MNPYRESRRDEPPAEPPPPELKKRPITWLSAVPALLFCCAPLIAAAFDDPRKLKSWAASYVFAAIPTAVAIVLAGLWMRSDARRSDFARARLAADTQAFLQGVEDRAIRARALVEPQERVRIETEASDAVECDAKATASREL